MKNLEIERKFLVLSDAFKPQAFDQVVISQGYLSSVPERTVRVRINNTQAFLTVKGLSSASGMSRFEWEIEIPLAEAQSLMALCEEGVIEKTRYKIDVGGSIFEVDEFYGDNKGLTLAEIELDTEQQVFTRPSWLGEEVTGQRRYYNSMLLKQPFSSWSF